MLAAPIESKGQPGPLAERLSAHNRSVGTISNIERNACLFTWSSLTELPLLKFPARCIGLVSTNTSSLSRSSFFFSLSPLMRRSFFLAWTSHIDDYALSFSQPLPRTASRNRANAHENDASTKGTSLFHRGTILRHHLNRHFF